MSSSTTLDITHHAREMVERNGERNTSVDEIKKELEKQLSEMEVIDDLSIDNTGFFLTVNTGDSVAGRAFAEPPAESYDWRAA